MLARVEGKKIRLHQNKLLYCNDYSKSVWLEILHLKPLPLEIIILIIQRPPSDDRKGKVMLTNAILLEFFIICFATDIVKGLVILQNRVPLYCDFSCFLVWVNLKMSHLFLIYISGLGPPVLWHKKHCAILLLSLLDQIIGLQK